MSEEFKSENPQAGAPAGQDVVVLIKRMQQQLLFLEKKIDMLISLSQERPEGRDRGFSKPFRPSFSHSHRPDNRYENRRESGGREGDPRERGFSAEHHGFSHKKRPFYQRRRERG